MKDQSPGEFEKAVQFDRMIRYQTKKGSEQLNYIHKSMTPLSEVVFNIDDPNQVDMFNSECEGMCGL